MTSSTTTSAFESAIVGFVASLDDLQVDATRDAFEICRAMIDVDGMLTDEELLRFVEVFAPKIPGLQTKTPAELRRSKFFTRTRTFLQQPSPLFHRLVGSDQADHGCRAATYLTRAVELMHTIASLDAHVSHVELAAIDGFRKVLTTAANDAGVPAQLSDDHGTNARRTTEEPQSLRELIAELDSLIGLEPVKQRVRQLCDLLTIMQMRRERGLMVPAMTHHLAFVGNPGTGKTTVARLIGRIYRALGLLEKGHLVEVDRADLVAGYVGQTATKVDEVIASAVDGVLLIDEAYGLVRGTDEYGAEAVDALVKRMEDHRDRVVIILTGYPDELNALLDSNPGLRSRIARVIEFPDYTDEELVAIFARTAAASGYGSGMVLETVRRRFASTPRDRQFGNGRAARQLFEDMMIEHASRVAQMDYPSERDLVELLPEDLPAIA
ncbi:MAG: AAA family ATPase [Acidimicrobiales bacterium]|nr:AAA family ATPase [Acidimicrobiales bacterium]